MWLYGVKNKLILFSHYPPSFLKWSMSGGLFKAFSVSVAFFLCEVVETCLNICKNSFIMFCFFFFLILFTTFFSSKTQLPPSVSLGWSPWSHPWLKFFSHNTPWIPADPAGAIPTLSQISMTSFCATTHPPLQAIVTKCGFLSQPPFCASRIRKKGAIVFTQKSDLVVPLKPPMELPLAEIKYWRLCFQHPVSSFLLRRHLLCYSFLPTLAFFLILAEARCLLIACFHWASP